GNLSVTEYENTETQRHGDTKKTQQKTVWCGVSFVSRQGRPKMDRRQILKGAVTGMVTLWASPLVRAAQQPAGGVRRLTDNLGIIDAGGSNVVVFSAGDGLVLVDSGAPKSGDALTAALKSFAASGKVQTLFNTHYHLDQTGNNEIFATA